MSSSIGSTSAPRGGVSTRPTPANNMGSESSGLGDPGFLKGGPSLSRSQMKEGETTTIQSARLSSKDFSSLRNEREAEERHHREHQERSQMDTGSDISENQTRAAQEPEFMEHKPGQESDTLPGWEKVKDTFKSATGSH